MPCLSVLWGLKGQQAREQLPNACRQGSRPGSATEQQGPKVWKVPRYQRAPAAVSAASRHWLWGCKTVSQQGLPDIWAAPGGSGTLTPGGNP